MVKLNTKIKGFTLIEVLVSLTLIMLSFGIGLMIYINVIKSDHNYLKLEALAAIKQVSNETKIKKQFIDEEYSFENVDINKTITKYNGSQNLYIISIEAFDKNGKKINELKEMVISD